MSPNSPINIPNNPANHQFEPFPHRRNFARGGPGKWIPAILALSLLSASGASGQAEPRIGSIEPVFDSFGSGGIFQLDIEQLDKPSKIIVEQADSLASGGDGFAPVNDATLAVTSGFSAVVSQSDGADSEFFRARVEPIPVEVMPTTSGYTLNISQDTPLEEILAVFAQDTGRLAHRSLFPEGEQRPDGATGNPVVEAGQYEVRNIEQFGREVAGVSLWSRPPETDDEGMTNRYPPSEIVQEEAGAEPVPGDNGTGEMGSWPGDEGLGLPEEGQAVAPPIETGEGFMPFDPETEPAEGGNQEPPETLDPEHHIRLSLRFTKDGTISVERVIDLLNAGDAKNSAPPPVPGHGAYILVARAQNVNAPGNIYHFGTFTDPLATRSYSPPFRGAHGSSRREEGIARVPLPVFQADAPAEQALEGATIDIYKAPGAGAFDKSTPLLTPEIFAGNPEQFQKVFSVSGGELLQQLETRQPGGGIQTLAPVNTPTIETIHRGGSNGAKFNICIVGDGFDGSSGDQQTYRDYVENSILGMFEEVGMHPQILNAVNIFRIDAESKDSGVTQIDSNNNVTTSRDTAFDYQYSGNWNQCWFRPNPDANTPVRDTVNNLCPQADEIIVVMNERGFGGCARGNIFGVTLGGGRAVVAHELGHSFGNLGDEYQCTRGGSCGRYTGGDPGAVNLDNATTRANVGWEEWIPSWRPIPTGAAQVGSNTQDVGVFPGATIGSNQWWNGIYRPSLGGRMRGNTPPHNPVGFTEMRANARPRREATFRKNAVGDFNGDGMDDLVRLDGRQLSLYVAAERHDNIGPDDPIRNAPPRGNSAVLQPTWFNTDHVRNDATGLTWQTRPGDVLLPADFNGDGRDDLYVINKSDWKFPYLTLLVSRGDHFEPVTRYDNKLPGWNMRSGDEYYVGDTDGDGDDDLMVFNGKDWQIPYFGMFEARNDQLDFMARYDKFLPGWEMGRREKFHVGDYNGDGSEDVIAFNRRSWNKVHLQVQRSTGNGLSLGDRHYGRIDPGSSSWQMRREDALHTLDFNGDERDEVVLFNGLDWNPTYLGMLETDENGALSIDRRYDNKDNPLPGWQMRNGDRHFPADVDGDGDDDLAVANSKNWNHNYLGMLKASVASGLPELSGSWQEDRVGSWNLRGIDDFRVADFRGSGGWTDLFVFNDGWMGLLRSYKTRYVTETLYRKWITNHRYHDNGWW